MYIAYSALQNPLPGGQQQPELNQPETPSNELQLRYHAYQTVCNKYRQEIAAIQQYIPGWQPKFY